MVKEELRRSTKKPTDVLKELPPLPQPNFKDHLMLAREYERVRASRPPVAIDFSRDKVESPPVNKLNDETAWKLAFQKAQCFLQYQAVRRCPPTFIMKGSACSHHAHFLKKPTRQL
ncbi:hypothetical protein EV1_028043 [Malus domestica]